MIAVLRSVTPNRLNLTLRRFSPDERDRPFVLAREAREDPHLTKRAEPPPKRACLSKEGARAKRGAARGSEPLLLLSLKRGATPWKPEGGRGSCILRSFRSPSMQRRRSSRPLLSESQSSEGRGAPLGRRIGTARAKPAITAWRASLLPPCLSAARLAVTCTPEERAPWSQESGAFE